MYIVPIQNHIFPTAVSPEGGVRIVPENATFNDSDTVTLMCITLGGPGNTFQWSFNGEDVENVTSSVLTLTNVSAEDGGMYTCNITNSAGSDTYNTYVFISPMIVSVAQVITLPLMVTRTEELQLTCTAEGFPLPSITWTHNGTDIDAAVSSNIAITEDTSMGIELTSTLTVTNTSISDSGDYTCRADSSEFPAVTSDTVLVLIQGQKFVYNYLRSTYSRFPKPT